MSMQQPHPADVRKAMDYYNRGASLINHGRYEEALATFNKAIALDPSDAYAYYSRGAALGKLGRHKEALAAFEQARRLNPNLTVQSYASKRRGDASVSCF